MKHKLSRTVPVGSAPDIGAHELHVKYLVLEVED